MKTQYLSLNALCILAEKYGLQLPFSTCQLFDIELNDNSHFVLCQPFLSIYIFFVYKVAYYHPSDPWSTHAKFGDATFKILGGFSGHTHANALASIGTS